MYRFTSWSKPIDFSNQKSGNYFENLASCYLRKNGKVILQRGQRFHNIQIDILALEEKTSTLFFYEVKKILKKHYSAGYPPFSKRQFNRYKKAVEHTQMLSNKMVDCRIGLLMIFENLEIQEILLEK